MKWWIKTSAAMRTILRYEQSNDEHPDDYGRLRTIIKKYDLDVMFDSIVGKVDSFYGMCTAPNSTELSLQDLKLLVE